MGNRRLGLLFFGTVLIAFFAGFQSQTFFVTNEPEEFTDVYQQITEALDRYYYYDLDQGEKDQAYIAQMEAIVNAYATLNNDPYTRISAAALNVAPTGDESYVGLGITIAQDTLGLRVLDVLYQGPSFGKLYPNDLIIGLMDGTTAIYYEDLDDSVLPTSYLSGSVDETKSLIVMQPDQEEVVIDITYESIATPTAYSKQIDENIAYLKITEFSGYIEGVTEGTAKVFSDRLNALEDTILLDSSDTLILDLRDNPGGSLTALHNQGSQGLIPGITQQLLIKNVEMPLFSMINKLDIKEDYFSPSNYDFARDINQSENYAEAKRQAEAVFFQEAKFPVVAARFPIVLGEDDYTKRLLFHIDRVLEEKEIFFPNIKARISFIHSDWFMSTKRFKSIGIEIPCTSKWLPGLIEKLHK